jgi:outer membrane immunogenic protein
MKKLLLSTVAFAGLTAGALAADLPSRRAAPAPYVAVPVFTWTGFYVGVNAGYGFDVGQTTQGPYTIGGGVGVSPAGALPAGSVVTPGTQGGRDGFVGGGQIGYNYQIGSFVVGVEADIQYADLVSNRSAVYAFAPAPAGFAAAGGNRAGIEWFGTVRGRLGYAFDRALVYGTGGFAYGDGPDDCNTVGAFGRAARCGGGDIRTGWAAGGGVEYAFTPNMTGKIEALYVNLDRTNASRFIGTAGGVAATPVFVTGQRARDEEFVVVRAGLNYKFGTY